jgi:hypothetical protein
MNSEIEKLIDLAIADGYISDKERDVIYKKAAILNIDKDEVDMIIEAKKHIFQSKLSSDHIKCPSCGKNLSGLAKTCTCGYIFNAGIFNEVKSLESAIEVLESLIVEVRGLSSRASVKKVESLTAKIEKEIRFIKTRYADSNEVKVLLSELETNSQIFLSKAKKRSRRRKIIINSILFTILIYYISFYGIRIYKNNTFKSNTEIFNIEISDKYGDDYNLYRKSITYRNDSLEFVKLFKASRLVNFFTPKEISDSIKNQYLKWQDNKNISEFYFYSKSVFYFLNNNNSQSKLFLDTALALNNKFSPIYFQLSRVIENKDTSIKYINMAIMYDEKNDYLYLPNRAQIYLDKSDYINSLTDLNLYFEKYPKDYIFDLERYLMKITILINGGEKLAGCNEFNKLSEAQKLQIKDNLIDTYNQIISTCKN